MNNKNKLSIIKSTHTLIRVFSIPVVFYLLYTIVAKEMDYLARACIFLLMAEGIVLLAFERFSPPPGIARNYTGSEKHNLDIFWPNWLTKYAKFIYTSMYVLVVLMLFYNLRINWIF